MSLHGRKTWAQVDTGGYRDAGGRVHRCSAKDGRVGLAEGYYRAALATDPDFPQALFNLAILRTAAGDSEEAIDLYLHAIELDPSDANALFNVGMLLRDSGRQKTAERYLNQALELDPTLADRLSGEPAGS